MHEDTETGVHREAARVMRSRARTFHLASLFLPASIRRDVRIVYAYYRAVDDLVDEPPDGWTRQDILRELGLWQDGLEGATSGTSPLMTALLEVVERRGIPRSYLHMVLEGARFDLDMRCIETRDELVRYSILVAGSVGMVMAHVLEARRPAASGAACDLGVAMQLTNILRDIGEDLGRGRIYLPLADLRAVRGALGSLHAGQITPALCTVMGEIMAEARERYARGMAGIQYLPPSARFPIYLAGTLYAQILHKIEREGFDVFSRRVHLGPVEKWMLALPAYAQHRQLVSRHT